MPKSAFPKVWPGMLKLAMFNALKSAPLTSVRNFSLTWNVFAALNAVSQVLLHKFSKQNEVPQTAPLPVAIPVEPSAQQTHKQPA